MKTLGQICHEARGDLYAGSMLFATPLEWKTLPLWQQRELETMAAAVAAHSTEPLRQLLLRIRQWDMLDVVGDGPFWKREIDQVLSEN